MTYIVDFKQRKFQFNQHIAYHLLNDLKYKHSDKSVSVDANG